MKYVDAVEELTSYECSGTIKEIKDTEKYKQGEEVLYIYSFGTNY